MLKLICLYTDKLFDVFAIEFDGKCLIKDFIDGLLDSDKRKITKLLEFTARNGTPKNTEKFHQLYCKEMDIYEFKQKPYRILCTIQDRKIILSHCFHKPKRRQLEREINKAVGLFKQYFEGHQNEKGK